MTTFRSRTRSTTTIRGSMAGLLGAALVVTFAPHAGAAAAADRPDAIGARTSSGYVVPAGVTRVSVDMAGSIGTGGNCDQIGGWGGRVTATIPVVPGETLQYNVADSLTDNSSDIRRDPFTPDDRLVVAGGGGYNADHSGGDCAPGGSAAGLGGDGGKPAGDPGGGVPDGPCGSGGGHGGEGGTLSHSGAGGAICGDGGSGFAGGFGPGGLPGGYSPAPSPCSVGGFGGSGWYGGGGGATTAGPPGTQGGCTDSLGNPIANPPMGGGGGGGSSHVVSNATGVVYKPGVNGNLAGWVTITPLHRPKVSGLSSHAGPVGGGRTVTILGSHLKGHTVVKFGTKQASHVVIVSATKITVHSPAHAAGRVDVRVSTRGGTSPKVRADRYTFR